MALYYIWSGAAGAGTGADWANAYTTLLAAVSGKSAGDTFYLAHDHAESTAADLDIISPGTKFIACRFLCVNRSGSVPPVSADLMTTATITQTTSGQLWLDGDGWYVYGVSFISSGSQIKLGKNGAFLFLQNCKFVIQTSGSAVTLDGGSHLWDNCTVSFSHANQRLLARFCVLHWRNTANAILGAAVPTELIEQNSDGVIWLIEGVDLSAINTRFINGSAQVSHFVLKDCKVHPSVTLTWGPQSMAVIHDFIRCDSAGTNYRTERYTHMGALTTETTIVRTGGASDGTTPISWKIVTTVDAEWHKPFYCFPISIWNETTGSAITVTVEGIWGGGAVPLNDEVWMDVEYLGSASYPIGSFVTTNKADVLATGTNTTASSEIWGGSTTAFKLVASVTPQMKGPITVYVKVAKPSSTFYIDPKITLS